MSATSIALKAPAKLNLFLHVVGRRADGMHLLESVFVLIDLCDDIVLEFDPSGKISRTGDVIGDINSRRGRIEGFEDIGGGKLVKAFVPLAEMFGYSTDLRSKTQGRGNYSMFFEKYEPVPKNVQDKVLAAKAK